MGASVNFTILYFLSRLCQLRRLAKLAPLPLRLMLRAGEPINSYIVLGSEVWGSAPRPEHWEIAVNLLSIRGLGQRPN